jgi:hypothetical protein
MEIFNLIFKIDIPTLSNTICFRIWNKRRFGDSRRMIPGSVGFASGFW